MNLDELRSVQSKERQKDSLQNLRPSFYQEVGEYIAELEDERERVAEQADDPFSSPEVGRLTDEIETAKDVVEAIYERRMGKLVKQASLAAAGMAADDEGLTAEEGDLFEDLVDRIQSNKTRVLDVLEGVGADSGAGRDDSSPVDAPTDPTRADDAPPTPPMEPAADGDPIDGDRTSSTESSGVTPADVMGGDGPAVDESGAGTGAESEPDAPSPVPSDDGGGEPLERERAGGGSESGSGSKSDESPTAAADADANVGDAAAVDRVTVRITRDVGSILGVDDREYTLSSDDVVTLPEQNASPLVERDAAEPLE
ncbi:DNA replication complex subunit Gins51 [Natronococcus wangiae]|uniref:DNA replication complex subunit Gins51 n=1 Tax=Natronococcus wangiae TaxID=3068275 RepID=UPI00273FABE3|nr:hypothetical protein [Natronococcus sp. AD5]